MDAPNVGPNWTVRELVRWWAASGFAARMASRVTTERRLARYLVAELGDLACADLTAEHIEGLLARLDGPLGASALNHLLSDLRRAIRAARAARRWPWDDPSDFVKPRRVPTRIWRTLSPAECRALLWGAKPQHLALFATALYTGMRKGELLALRVEDVDIAARRIYVRRSRRRDTTKNGRARLAPISNELALYLKLQLEAVATIGGRFVFPGTDGRSQRENNSKMSRAASTALKAGGCALRIRFQDLRHTFATLLRRGGVDRDLVAALMGHIGKATTLLYTHFSEADLLDAVNRLAIGAPRRMNDER